MTKRAPRDERASRMASALRANLRRRKQQEAPQGNDADAPLERRSDPLAPRIGAAAGTEERREDD